MEYQHGGDIYSQDIQMDYSANINPLGMPEAVRQALRDCLEREVCSLYPDSRCERLRQALGKHHGVEDKWIICGNGAADLIFGLAAALRPVRGLVTAPAFSERLQAVRQPWSVSGPAQCAGVAALGETDFAERTRAVLKGERERLSAALHDLGFQVYPSQANYLFFRDREEDGILEKGRLYQELLGRRILIRSCANYPGLDSSFYRICVKLRQDNEQLIREMARVLERRKSCPNIQNQS